MLARAVSEMVTYAELLSCSECDSQCGDDDGDQNQKNESVSYYECAHMNASRANVRLFRLQWNNKNITQYFQNSFAILIYERFSIATRCW